jgi:hypothetical protein
MVRGTTSLTGDFEAFVRGRRRWRGTQVLEGPRNDANLFVQTTNMRNFNANQGQNVERAAATMSGARCGLVCGSGAANSYVRAFNPGRRMNSRHHARRPRHGADPGRTTITISYPTLSKTLETNYYARSRASWAGPQVAFQSNDANVPLRPIAMAASTKVAYAFGVHRGSARSGSSTRIWTGLGSPTPTSRTARAGQ